jgi:zinc and cadmium transporter
MEGPVALTIGSVVLVSLASLIGIVLVPAARHPSRESISVLMSLAVGAMLGGAFLHLIPESLSQAGNIYVPALLTIGGLVAFSLLEVLVKRRLESHANPYRSVGYMNLIADGIHNFVDGVAIAAAYLAGPEVGTATTFAVLFHEVPQELGDFGVLLHAGFSWKRALAWNFACAALSLLGAGGTLLLGGNGFDLEAPLLPIVAGAFLYVALVDLLPELWRNLTPRLAFMEISAIFAGVAIPYLFSG